MVAAVALTYQLPVPMYVLPMQNRMTVKGDNSSFRLNSRYIPRLNTAQARARTNPYIIHVTLMHLSGEEQINALISSQTYTLDL
jgi:hypothetical protein